MVGEIPFFGLCHFCSMFYIRFHSASRFTPFFSSLISNYQFKYIVLAWTVQKAITNRISLAVVLFFVSSMGNIKKHPKSHRATAYCFSVASSRRQKSTASEKCIRLKWWCRIWICRSLIPMWTLNPQPRKKTEKKTNDFFIVQRLCFFSFFVVWKKKIFQFFACFIRSGVLKKCR